MIEKTIDLIQKGKRHDALVEALREFVEFGELMEQADDWYAPPDELMSKARAALEEVE